MLDLVARMFYAARFDQFKLRHRSLNDELPLRGIAFDFEKRGELVEADGLVVVAVGKPLRCSWPCRQTRR